MNLNGVVLALFSLVGICQKVIQNYTYNFIVRIECSDNVTITNAVNYNTTFTFNIFEILGYIYDKQCICTVRQIYYRVHSSIHPLGRSIKSPNSFYCKYLLVSVCLRIPSSNLKIKHIIHSIRG